MFLQIQFGGQALVLLNIFLMMNLNNVSGSVEDDGVQSGGRVWVCFPEQRPGVFNNFSHPLGRLCFCSCFAFHTEEQEISWYPWVPEKPLPAYCFWNGLCDRVFSILMVQEIFTPFYLQFCWS